MATAEDAADPRLPPPPGEIARLPPDGGPEFNRLVFEQSPYLLQHARNPVDWRPWGEEAFARARAEDKPVLLSIGYATCHWCHVMERESFEDEEVARIVNGSFIPVKVDREERPDIDEIYMQVTQAMTGSGGWPMTVFLTPEGHAFFAGTYFPKETVAGRIGFKTLLTRMSEAWTERREEIEDTAGQITGQLGMMMTASPGEALDPALFDEAYAQYRDRFDERRGGFSTAPKFPVPANLMFLLRQHRRSGDPEALAMVERTLEGIHRGGVYDQIGFGVHRYSTDAEWLLPHFEKMLYDQALLAMAAVEAHQATGAEDHARLAREVLTYVLRDMTGPEGGFHSAEDADSEGEEGKFYVWTLAELLEVLGEEDGAFVAEIFGFEEQGNYLDERTRRRTGTNIPHLQREPSAEEREHLDPLRRRLHEHREGRVRPFKDDKVLTDWNGLMIAAFARAAQVLGDPEYAAAAARAADFVLERLRTPEGRLLKRYRGGEAGLTAHLEDYAFLIWGLLDLYEAVFDLRYLEEAAGLQEILDEFFWDPEEGGYFTTASDAEELIVRAKKIYGGALPSGNAVSLGNLARLYRMTGRSAYAERAGELERAFSGEVAEHPASFPMLLCWLDLHFGPSVELLVSAPEHDEAAQSMIDAARGVFLPSKVVMLRTEGNASALAALAPFTEGQGSIDGAPTAYVCRDFACELPVTSVEEMLELMLRASPPEAP